MSRAEHTPRRRTSGYGNENEGRLRQLVGLLEGEGYAAAEQGKSRLAVQVAGLARAVRRGSETLYEDDLARLAQLGEVLADELEAAGTYLNTRSAEGLLREVRFVLARRQSVVIGSAFAAGLLAGYLTPKLRRRRHAF